MIDGLMTHVPSLGIAGLLFVMWWYERQERVRNADGVQESLRCTAQAANVNERLLDVIRANTEALTALREELRSQRESEAQWRMRIAQQIERLGAG